ncbi:hypothetical protein DDB_G0285275 [Dictyostelium discoideum AX4]|uniref:Chromatin modification-related protein EAF6 n=1 Tax=Dictyostelium discoideum TaxID=44689 RepID=Q54NG3_DICDI|nr:hypothetical protein DDB_G0285275 [Dictyostelium discoideum AX4]EAL64801.1 hypothetical protein DDB_G0285275 [Dictyostelium discoideum AX4]|eukprot:XP_638306.1 hypothetical protein DDB_G0285275 [Dictyostelium discoideum AX4]
MSENKDVTMETEEETIDGEDVIEDNEKSVNKKSNKKSSSNIPIPSLTPTENNDKKIVTTTNETNSTPTTVSTSSSTNAQPSNTTNTTTTTLPSPSPSPSPSTTTTNTLNSNTDTSSSSSSLSSSTNANATPTTTPTPTTTTTTTTAAVVTPIATILPKKRMKQEVIVEIEELMSEKKNIENKLATLEKQIYALEGRYLEDTHHVGNVIRGFDSYISGSGALKKLRWKESDRLFSTSSSTYLNSINDRNEIVEQDNVIKKKRDKGKLSSSSNSSKKN